MDEASEDVLGGVELVLVEGVVLDAAGPEEGVGGFDVQATAGEDGDLGAVPVVEVVVGGLGWVLVYVSGEWRHETTYPEPVVLKVRSLGGLCDVDVGVCGHAVCVHGAGGTLSDL